MQMVEGGLKKQMTTQTSEMKQMKEDRDESEEYEKVFRSAIVSEEATCSSVEIEWCIMTLLWFVATPLAGCINEVLPCNMYS